MEWKKIKRNIIKTIPRQKHLRGTFLHKTLGESLFCENLWKWEKESTSRGIGIGLFWSMMPLPFQMLPASICAFFVKCNIPAAAASVWVSNPITWPPILYFQFLVGKTLCTTLSPPLQLLLGCALSAIVLSSTGYLITQALWKKVEKPATNPL